MKQKIWKSFGYALTGLKVAWKEELNFKIEIVSAILVTALSYALKISMLEYAVVILTIGFVLATETLNTSLEELCDKFQPTHDPHIAKIKDLAAAAVLLAAITALAVSITIFGKYFF